MLSQFVNANKRITSDLNDLKQAPFTSRRRASSNRSASSSGRRGRRVGHPGQARARPERIDQTERVEIGETYPDCDTPLTGKTQVRSRVVEDIELVRPTRSLATRLSAGGVLFWRWIWLWKQPPPTS